MTPDLEAMNARVSFGARVDRGHVICASSLFSNSAVVDTRFDSESPVSVKEAPSSAHFVKCDAVSSLYPAFVLVWDTRGPTTFLLEFDSSRRVIGPRHCLPVSTPIFQLRASTPVCVGVVHDDNVYFFRQAEIRIARSLFSKERWEALYGEEMKNLNALSHATRHGQVRCSSFFFSSRSFARIDLCLLQWVNKQANKCSASERLSSFQRLRLLKYFWLNPDPESESANPLKNDELFDSLHAEEEFCNSISTKNDREVIEIAWKTLEPEVRLVFQNFSLSSSDLAKNKFDIAAVLLPCLAKHKIQPSPSIVYLVCRVLVSQRGIEWAIRMTEMKDSDDFSLKSLTKLALYRQGLFRISREERSGIFASTLDYEYETWPERGISALSESESEKGVSSEANWSSDDSKDEEVQESAEDEEVQEVDVDAAAQHESPDNVSDQIRRELNKSRKRKAESVALSKQI